MPSKALHTGALTSRFCVGDHAGQDRHHRDVEEGADQEEAMMPIGTSRCGLRASSVCVETASKPM